MKIKVLSRADLIDILEMPDVIAGVEAVYKEKAVGNVVAWPLVEHHFDDKGSLMDIRSGGVFGEVGTHGAKLLNNFPGNRELGLPVFTGVLMTFDSTTGIPLGVMDASYITSMRTGAAAAIGAAALARPDSENLLLVGAGLQSIYLLGATLIKMPQIKTVRVIDTFAPDNPANYVASIASRLKDELGINASGVCFEAAYDMKEAVAASDVILTITRSTSPLIMKDWLKPGNHLSCIGADMLGKEEIDPEIFRTARSFAYDARQCCTVGEMEIPAKMGIISPETVAGEIGEVLAGLKPGRLSDEDITVFDATGLAALDLVTAKAAVAAANAKGLGTTVEI